MAPDSLKKAKKLFPDYRLRTTDYGKNLEIVIAPPFVYLPLIADLRGSKLGFTRIAIGAQDVFYENSGAYTGEISASMLKNFGVEYVLVGHSERRKYLNETDEMINKKVLMALKAGLKVVLCIGEDLSIRRRGKKAVEKFIKIQLEKGLKNSKLRNHLVIAYEPVWAINTGHSDTPQDAVEMIKFIKKTLLAKPYALNPKVLYGGSVDSKNIGNFLKRPEINGALVGHASLKAGEVKKILKGFIKK